MFEKILTTKNIEDINETLIKTGVVFFNLHHMEKGYSRQAY